MAGSVRAASAHYRIVEPKMSLVARMLVSIPTKQAPGIVKGIQKVSDALRSARRPCLAYDASIQQA